MKYFENPTIYCSHSIRGPQGPNATELEIRKNCKNASLIGEKLRRCFPDVGFYLPADGDLTLQILTASQRLNIDDVMFADLQILESCSGYLWLYTGSSRGCETEWKKAYTLGLISIKPGSIIHDNLLKMSYSKLRKRIGPIIDASIERFRRTT